jgi:hypothetical protein
MASYAPRGFADFGRTGKHREHDAFADMEAADLRSGLETAVASKGDPRDRGGVRQPTILYFTDNNALNRA